MIKPYSLLIFLGLSVALPESRHCRCLPHEPCWPSDRDWKALNTTVDGNLFAVKPVASVCHDPTFNEAACKEVTSNYSGSQWRASQAGAVQWVNWETWPQQDQSCYPQSPRDSPCGQGRISLYSAAVKTVGHVQAAVRFAKRNNIRLVIKNSGHDFLGRSAAADSLQIHTHWMKAIDFSDDFFPEAKKGQVSRGEGQAVTIGAGVILKDLYSASLARGVIIVAGTARTVGAAGGYIQGGGHSILGHWKGLASDNALEFRVVTAEGDLVIANEYQNTDLFWALRGGGGGTFGVVVSVTIRTFPEAPVVYSAVNITIPADISLFWDAFTEVNANIPILNDAGGTGYYIASPNVADTGEPDIAVITVAMFFVNQTDSVRVKQLFQPMIKNLNAMPGVTATYLGGLTPSVASVLALIIGGEDDVTGTSTLLVSRMFSRDLLASPEGPSKLTSALKTLRLYPGKRFTGHIVAGGAASNNGKKIDSALNPAWRKAGLHLVTGRGWPLTATYQEQQAIISNATEVEIPILRSVEGENSMGAYLNEANAYEPNFQQSFWGDNYKRLYHIKQKWDPSGLFISRRGVGSEDWDDEGLCRSRNLLGLDL